MLTLGSIRRWTECILTLGSVRRWTACIAARVRERARAAARASERARHSIACTHCFPLGNEVDRLYSLFLIWKLRRWPECIVPLCSLRRWTECMLTLGSAPGSLSLKQYEMGFYH